MLFANSLIIEGIAVFVCGLVMFVGDCLFEHHQLRLVGCVVMKCKSI